MICSQPIHYSDGKGEETVPVSGGFGVQRSVAPAKSCHFKTEISLKSEPSHFASPTVM